MILPRSINIWQLNPLVPLDIEHLRLVSTRHNDDIKRQDLALRRFQATHRVVPVLVDHVSHLLDLIAA